MTNLPTFDFEKELWNQGYDLVIGVDEVGRGSFAGPVVASAVAFAPAVSSIRYQVLSIEQLGINDSKLLTPNSREKLDKEIKKYAIYGIGEVGVATINKVGIGKATAMAMRKAVRKLLHGYMVNMAKIVKVNNNITMQPFSHSSSWFLLVDAFYIPYLNGIPKTQQKPIVKGDQKSISIAAASIIAKVYRDKLMVELSGRHENYGWGKNKGYGTAEHQKAIVKYGMTSFHRITFVETFLSGAGL